MPGCPISKTGSSQEVICFMVPSSWEGTPGLPGKANAEKGAQDQDSEQTFTQNWEVWDNSRTHNEGTWEGARESGHSHW